MDIASIAGKPLTECTAGEFVDLMAEALKRSTTPPRKETPDIIRGWGNMAKFLGVSIKKLKSLNAQGYLGKVIRKDTKEVCANSRELKKAYDRYLAGLPRV